MEKIIGKMGAEESYNVIKVKVNKFNSILDLTEESFSELEGQEKILSLIHGGKKR